MSRPPPGTPSSSEESTDVEEVDEQAHVDTSIPRGYSALQDPPAVNRILTETEARNNGASIALRGFYRRARRQANQNIEQATDVAYAMQRSVDQYLRGSFMLGGYLFIQPRIPFTPADNEQARPQPVNPRAPRGAMVVLPPVAVYQDLIDNVSIASEEFFTWFHGMNDADVKEKLEQLPDFIEDAWPRIQRAIRAVVRETRAWLRSRENIEVIRETNPHTNLIAAVQRLFLRDTTFDMYAIQNDWLHDIFFDEINEHMLAQPGAPGRTFKYSAICREWRIWVHSWLDTLERLITLQDITPGVVHVPWQYGEHDEEEEEEEEE